MCALGEEALLIKFFGEEYTAYRERTRVGIPFIR
jgi:protein-S-isoprenylcysteine O-methyltransferase Ste14